VKLDAVGACSHEPAAGEGREHLGRAGVVGCDQLVRQSAAAYVVVALAVLGIVDVLMQVPDALGGTSAILTRVGGILMAIAMIRVCLEAERAAIEPR